MSGQDEPQPRDTAVTGGGHGGHGALDTALAYYQAWTSHDFERAMTYIAEVHKALELYREKQEQLA